MPTHFFSLTILTQNFADETHLAEALNFHEISRFHTNLERATLDVRVNAEQILKDIYPTALHTRLAVPDNTIEVKEIFVEVAPPKKSSVWRDKINLRFHVLEFAPREDGYLRAYVPALGILVLTKKANDFEEKIRQEILSTLSRDGYTKSLQFLRRLENVESVSVRTEELAVQLPTTKQRAVAEEKDETEEKSVLKEIGTDLTKIKLKAAYEGEKQIEIIAEILRAKQKSGVLLVGAAGVGKTAIFHELVTRRKQLGFPNETEFWATGGARLIAGQAGFGMWQQRCQKLIDEAKKREAILHLGNLIELLEVGKSLSSTQGIASFLRPKIARGEIRVVVECTPEQIPVLERRDPNLLAAFQQIKIEEPSAATTLKILESVAHEFTVEPQNRKIDSEAIKTAAAIHRRYSNYSAMPGKPARFLRNLLSSLEYDDALTPQTVYKSFSAETGLPEILLNDELNLDLAATSKFFAERVIGQDEAVRLVTELIATVKAKLTRPRKPVASLLFIGPTGVGKTELTKALAEFFFSDKARMARFDMSEFSNALSVQRLIGGTGESEGLLTAKVREQPFSVVLFDEFEKAHHSFFDLLLQILGEGRLTDARGRMADFTNSIIVMTSNLGASEFQRGKSGFTQNARARQAATKHFTSAVREFLRPEIFNRIDRIVPFAPLDEKTVLKIAALEIEKLTRRDGLRLRPVKLAIGKDVLNHLAKNGYDIRYGARPLKRTVERELLAPLATELNLRAVEEKLSVACGVTKDGKLTLEFVAEGEPKKRASGTSAVLATQAARVAELRRKTRKFSSSYRLTELSDELYQIARLQSLELRSKWLSDEDKERIGRKSKIEKFLENLKTFAVSVNDIENEILLEIYGKATAQNRNFSVELEAQEAALRNFSLELLALQYLRPNEVKFSLFSENAAALFRLARIYQKCVKENGGEIRRAAAFTSQKQPDQPSAAEKKQLFDREVWRKEIGDGDAAKRFFADAPAETIGILIEVEAELALPRFGAENGLHRFAQGNRNDRVLFNSTEAAFEKFQLPDELAKRDSIKFQFERRIYDLSQKQVKDLLLEKTFSLESADLPEIVAIAIKENLLVMAVNLIE